MLKRMFFFTVVVALLLPLGSFAHAQDSTLIFENLTQTATVTDLGFTFLFPEGWVADTSAGLSFAQNAEDLALLIDDDSASIPAGYTITLRAFAPSDLGLADDVSLDEAVATAATLAGLTVEAQFDYPFLAHRSIVVAGTNSNGKPGIASIWMQDKQIVFFSFGLTPDTNTSDAAFTWGYILSQAAYISDVELTETYNATEFGGFTINYPTGWTAGVDEAAGTYIVEFPADVAADNTGNPAQGSRLYWAAIPLERAGLTAKSTSADLKASILTNNPDVILDEYMLFGATGYGIDYGDGNITIAGKLNNELYFFIASAPSAEAMPTFKPILLKMLTSIQQPE